MVHENYKRYKTQERIKPIFGNKQYHKIKRLPWQVALLNCNALLGIECDVVHVWRSKVD